MTEHTQADGHPSATTYYMVFGALLVLLVVTVGVAELQVGNWALAVAAGVATTKAALILLYFMHVKSSRPLIWLVAGSGFFWLAILFGLTLSDYATRSGRPTSDPLAQHGDRPSQSSPHAD